jgi:hypothetical protein
VERRGHAGGIGGSKARLQGRGAEVLHERRKIFREGCERRQIVIVQDADNGFSKHASKLM